MPSLAVVRYCASEVLRQGEMNPMSVYDIVNAWDYAHQQREVGKRFPDLKDVMIIAHYVKNYSQANAIMGGHNWRQENVTIDGLVTGAKWRDIPRQMELWANNIPSEQWLVEFDRGIKVDLWEEHTKLLLIHHPWIDGNGRTASIARNWIFDRLDAPQPLPFYNFGSAPDE